MVCSLKKTITNFPFHAVFFPFSSVQFSYTKTVFLYMLLMENFIHVTKPRNNSKRPLFVVVKLYLKRFNSPERLTTPNLIFTYKHVFQAALHS